VRSAVVGATVTLVRVVCLQHNVRYSMSSESRCALRLR
jgi:hypothetical protein